MSPDPLRHTARRHARDLCERHLDVAERQASIHANSGLSHGELFQEGALALMALCQDWVARVHGRGLSAAEEAEFVASAETAVRARIQDAIRQAAEARENDRRIVADVEAFEAAETRLASELGHAPSDSQLAERLKWDEAKLNRIRGLRDDARLEDDLGLIPFLEDEDVDVAIAELLEMERRAIDPDLN